MKSTWSRLFSERSLLGDFLLLHLTFATLVGAVAVGGLWWTSSWVVDENLRKWALQWVDRLDALGTPLYVSLGDEELERVREYVRSFPEIALVRYYDADGKLLLEESPSPKAAEVPGLQSVDFQELKQLAESGASPRVDPSIRSGRMFRVSTSLWAESIVADGLIGFDPQEGGDQQRTLLGYVELGLDFDRYRATMTQRVLKRSLAIVLGLFALAVLGLLGFRRALRPLRNLQEPLSKLANGELDLAVPGGGHAELVAINTALANTIDALHQRDRKLRAAANFDPLTGLVSRAGLNEEIERDIQRVREGHDSSALLFVDLDQFKYVNDTVGHAAGDRLLVGVAGVLRTVAGADDIVCRYGGDEFIVLQRHAGRERAEQLASAIIDGMRAMHFVEEGRAFSVLCSIGVAMIDGCAVKAEEILAQADLACHEAKGQGRNRFRMFVGDRGDREQVAADMGWSERIREALNSDGFVLRYQPIIDVRGGPTTFYEVLVRMRGQGQIVVPPGAFLPAADRFGLMGDLDYWVIRHAFAKLAEVRKELPATVFALNLSGIAFSDARLVEFVSEQLAQHGLPGAAIVFEITEQVAIRHMQGANAIMRMLMDMGCRFALDDFGSGFSSFSYLKQLPVSYIKIDGAFIENLASDAADRAIVTSIAQIARAVGSATIAEHVRDAQTLAVLREIGIDLAQGYFLGGPQIDVGAGEAFHAHTL